jgi:hypothetical protein
MTRRTLLRILVAALVFLSAGSRRSAAATCTGANPCNACKNCRYCKRCAENGGTCGTCRQAMNESHGVRDDAAGQR